MPKLLCSCKKPHVLVLHKICLSNKFIQSSLQQTFSLLGQLLWISHKEEFLWRRTVGKQKPHHVVGRNLLCVLFWLNTGSIPKHLHKLDQTCTNLTKRNPTKHFITSTNFQKLMEPWIRQHGSWVVSRYNDRGPRRPSVRQCCSRPGDRESECEKSGSRSCVHHNNLERHVLFV